jgi:hypothetical protein
VGCRWETGYVMPVAIGFNRERAPKPYKCRYMWYFKISYRDWTLLQIVT